MAISFPILDQLEVDEVDALMKQNSSTLGFLPKQVLCEFLDQKAVIGARNDDGTLMGYLMYASYPERIRVVHLCVSKDQRRSGVAKQLMGQLIARCTTQCVIRLNCRNDFDADSFWPTLGFVPVGEKKGRSVVGHAGPRRRTQTKDKKTAPKSAFSPERMPCRHLVERAGNVGCESVHIRGQPFDSLICSSRRIQSWTAAGRIPDLGFSFNLRHPQNEGFGATGRWPTERMRALSAEDGISAIWFALVSPPFDRGHDTKRS